MNPRNAGSIQDEVCLDCGEPLDGIRVGHINLERESQSYFSAEYLETLSYLPPKVRWAMLMLAFSMTSGCIFEADIKVDDPPKDIVVVEEIPEII